MCTFYNYPHAHILTETFTIGGQHFALWCVPLFLNSSFLAVPIFLKTFSFSCCSVRKECAINEFPL